MKRVTIYSGTINGILKNITATIKNGSLCIEGQDTGDKTPFGNNKNEYFYIFSKEETTRFAVELDLPEVSGQMLDEMVFRFEGKKWYPNLKKFIKEHRLEYIFLAGEKV